jgi:hypothetical protein
LTGIVSVPFSLALRALSASESVEALDDLIDYGTGACLQLIAASKKLEPSREGAPGGLDRASGFPFPPLKFRTAGFPQYGFKWTVNGDLRRRPKA